MKQIAPATIDVIQQPIIKIISFNKEELGFKGLLISDDLSMEALSGDLFTRASKASEAGIDILLHCNGKLNEMEQVARATINVIQQPIIKIISFIREELGFKGLLITLSNLFPMLYILNK